MNLKKKALVKWNSGRGTILCSVCRVMLYQWLSAAKWAQANTPEGLPEEYCDKHKR